MLSAHKMTIGRVSNQQISPIKGQIVIYRPSIRPDSLRDALCAIFVGDWEEPFGESRKKLLTRRTRFKMSNLLKYFVSAAALVAASASNAFATVTVPLPVAVPAAGGLLGLAIVGVVGGVWLARRKR